jgi:hypothetical protein
MKAVLTMNKAGYTRLGPKALEEGANCSGLSLEAALLDFIGGKAWHVLDGGRVACHCQACIVPCHRSRACAQLGRRVGGATGRQPEQAWPRWVNPPVRCVLSLPCSLIIIATCFARCKTQARSKCEEMSCNARSRVGFCSRGREDNKYVVRGTTNFGVLEVARGGWSNSLREWHHHIPIEKMEPSAAPTSTSRGGMKSMKTCDWIK